MAETYFMKQQSSLGKVNAYLEENTKTLRSINQELRESAKRANRIANILMPVSCLTM